MQNWWIAQWVEVMGFVTGAACVVLAWRRNIWNYPIGIANTILFMGLFWTAGLYAQVGLQVVFLVLAGHGWIDWMRTRQWEASANLRRDEAFVSSVPRLAVLALVAAFVLVTLTVRWVLLEFTDSTVATSDAATMAASVVAQIMLNRRWWQSWLVWLAVDIAYVWLYLSAGLWITALLYGGFCIMCALALREWLAVRRAAQDTRADLVRV
ncbi:nicotinamide riboside transporter PnuC [Antrihabitans sp. NCIMB 15449]|jgi:nicotinamide mononucleotide transporter|uniref:Nicotinamide riboside transporter PnuC n=1 Tax=Antrihabitans spumae TaxID=3373370 RepID=A0ABW7JR68_9NOCA